MLHFIEKFEKQCPLEMERLEKAFENEDRVAIYQVAHSFKPQLEFVGIKGAAEIAATLEFGAWSEKSLQELEGLFEKLKAMLCI